MTEPGLTGRERRRLDLARDNAYLNASCQRHEELTRTYGLWCWRLKIPIVWLERQTPRSRYVRVHMEMFTTLNALTDNAQAAMSALAGAFDVRGRVAVSADKACWERVPRATAAALAKAAFKTAVRRGNYEQNASETAGLRKVPTRLTVVPFFRATA